jgi:hypothetical protein
LRDDPTVPDHTHQPLPQLHGIEGHTQLPSAATDLILLGDLTGRYATGSYSRLASDGRTVALRDDRQGAAEHGHRITAAIACHVARAGGPVDQLTRLLLHPDHEGGRHARNIALRSGQARALDYIRRVWASATKTVSTTMALGSRHDAYEVLAALRDRIETTPWHGERGRTALRVLRAHLNFAEIAGGPLHHASERQTAEEAGISRTTLRAVYESILKPQGWLRRLRAGHGREGSTWYLKTYCRLVPGPLSTPPRPGTLRPQAMPRFRRGPFLLSLTGSRPRPQRQHPAREHRGLTDPAGPRTFLRRPLSSTSASSRARVSTPPCPPR